jgi:hypothetical protein
MKFTPIHISGLLVVTLLWSNPALPQQLDKIRRARYGAKGLLVRIVRRRVVACSRSGRA